VNGFCNNTASGWCAETRPASTYPDMKRTAVSGPCRQTFGENQPIDLRHDDISQQQVNRPLVRGRNIQRFSTIAGFDNLIPMTGKDAPNEAADRFFVIDQQYGDDISDAGHEGLFQSCGPSPPTSGT
jgi:hypothetical protein